MGGPAKEAAKKKWSTGAKVAAGTTGVAVVGGLAVAGAVLGEHISEEGWEVTIADLGDVATSVGDSIAEGASHVADFASDTTDSAGEFIMDLFWIFILYSVRVSGLFPFCSNSPKSGEWRSVTSWNVGLFVVILPAETGNIISQDVV